MGRSRGGGTTRIERYRRVRPTERLAREEAHEAARSLAPALVRRLGLSIRDVGELLGSSHQRVHQLARR